MHHTDSLQSCIKYTYKVTFISLYRHLQLRGARRDPFRDVPDEVLCAGSCCDLRHSVAHLRAYRLLLCYEEVVTTSKELAVMDRGGIFE